MKPWEIFFTDNIKKIFLDKKDIIDIGGGLRINRSKNNRYDKDREWIIPFLKKVNYRIVDPVSDYNPDIVGDIHRLPFKDNSIDAVLCIAVLEHVEDPVKASNEMYRILKKGGYAYIYIYLFCIIIMQKGGIIKIIGGFLRMLLGYCLKIFLKWKFVQ